MEDRIPVEVYVGIKLNLVPAEVTGFGIKNAKKVTSQIWREQERMQVHSHKWTCVPMIKKWVVKLVPLL